MTFIRSPPLMRAFWYWVTTAWIRPGGTGGGPGGTPRAAPCRAEAEGTVLSSSPSSRRRARERSLLLTGHLHSLMGDPLSLLGVGRRFRAKQDGIVLKARAAQPVGGSAKGPPAVSS